MTGHVPWRDMMNNSMPLLWHMEMVSRKGQNLLRVIAPSANRLCPDDRIVQIEGSLPMTAVIISAR